MFDVPTFEQLNLGVTLPAVSLALGACIVLLIDLFLPEERKRITPLLAVLGLIVSFILNLIVFSPSTETVPLAMEGMFVADSFTGVLNIVALITAFLSILMSINYLERVKIIRNEYYILMLLSTAGIMFMISANDLIVIFIGLELLSIPLYVLSAFRSPTGPDDKMGLKSEESGLKYFILGAFSSAFFVYGSALIYGATGTTNLPEIFSMAGQILSGDVSTGIFLLLAGSALAFVGLGFKVAAVPFHMWTPDVYEGAPTPVTAFMSVGAKIGGFAALFRILVVGLSAFMLNGMDVTAWQNTIAFIAALTLILGNVVALSQTNVKRLLAYSSIAHAGYILIAVAAAGSPVATGTAVQSAALYLLAYAFTNLGAFGVVIALEKNDGTGTELEDFVGLGKSQPILAAAMAIFMLSLTGIPLTAGFVGKAVVFLGAVQAGLFPLAIIGVITSVISAYYYVRIIVNMYLRDDKEGDEAAGATTYVRWAVYASLAGTLILGILIPLGVNLVSMVSLVS